MTATVADGLAERLRTHGVSRVFGFPGGGGNLDVMDALDRSGIDFLLAHTEGGAALMAAATAEQHGVPGVVMVGNGPGLASVVNGVAHAHLDRVPLLVISDRYTDGETLTTGHQVLDQRRLLDPVVKWGATLDPGTAARTIDRALQVCHDAPAGPVHLDLPRDVASAPLDAGPPPASPAPPAAHGDLAAIAAAVERAQRPVVLIGLEAVNGLETSAVIELVELLGAAVLTTYKAKGVFPERHPLWAGILTGGTLERPLLEASDCLIALGLDPVELLTKPWPYSGPLVALRASDQRLDHGAPSASWVGELDAGVRALVERLPGRRAGGWPADAVAAHREQTLDRLRTSPDEPLTAWRVVEAMVEELPEAVTVAVDAGAHMFPATCLWRCDRPRRFLISNGLATMGFAVPAAVAAAVAAPNEVAVALTGDGGMAYHAYELETAARRGACVLVVVLNDSSLSLIRIKDEARGRRDERLDFGRVRFDRIAEGLGVRGRAVSTESEFRTAIRDALTERTSTVVDASISGNEYAPVLAAIRG